MFQSKIGQLLLDYHESLGPHSTPFRRRDFHAWFLQRYPDGDAVLAILDSLLSGKQGWQMPNDRSEVLQRSIEGGWLRLRRLVADRSSAGGTCWRQ